MLEFVTVGNRLGALELIADRLDIAKGATNLADSAHPCAKVLAMSCHRYDLIESRDNRSRVAELGL